ncbi:MAG: redoxin domain-containing protein, partial [Candidatus Marinimicrobia bacterium]|nr:redoxin domain-containing protein [Candidatus Neomarinimicrobiota bacterium]
MRKFLIWIVPLMLMTAAVAGELEIGSDIPMADVKMVDVSGKKVSLNDAVGENGLLVVFSCNTCPWVDAWEDRYISVSKLSQKKGVGMIAINPNQGSRNKGDGMV